MQRKHNGRWITIQNHDLDAPILEILTENGRPMHVGAIRTELEKRCVFGRYMQSYHKNQIRWRYLVNIRLYWLHGQMCVVKDNKPAVWQRTWIEVVVGSAGDLFYVTTVGIHRIYMKTLSLFGIVIRLLRCPLGKGKIDRPRIVRQSKGSVIAPAQSIAG